MGVFQMRHLGRLTWCRYDEGFWMRWRNAKGFSIRWAGEPLFSERNGYRRVIRVGRFRFEALK